MYNYRLLVELKNSKISLKEMSCECAAIKQIQRVQVAFIRGTNCENWTIACEKFPLFTTAEQLEPFKKLDFAGKTLPPTFMKFCQRAATSVAACADESLIQEDKEQDNIFTIHHEDCVAIFWKEEIKQVTPEKFMLMLKMIKPNESHSFPGFSLSIFDITLETDVRICCVLFYCCC